MLLYGVNFNKSNRFYFRGLGLRQTDLLKGISTNIIQIGGCKL